MKIFKNIRNNPGQTEKYGNLKFDKINKKLSSCKPALDLLFLSGFEKTKNNKRLIWMNTNNNMIMIQHIQHELQSNTIGDNNMSSLTVQSDNPKQSKQSNTEQQSQQVENTPINGTLSVSFCLNLNASETIFHC